MGKDFEQIKSPTDCTKQCDKSFTSVLQLSKGGNVSAVAPPGGVAGVDNHKCKVMCQ